MSKSGTYSPLRLIIDFASSNHRLKLEILQQLSEIASLPLPILNFQMLSSH